MYTRQQAMPMSVGTVYSKDVKKYSCNLPKTLFRVEPATLSGNMAALLELLPSSTSNNLEDSWYIEMPSSPAFLSSCNLPAVPCGESTILADRLNAMSRHQLYKNVSTGEHVYVTNVIGKEVQVTRGVGILGSLPIRAGDKFVLVGTSYSEASDRGTPIRKDVKKMSAVYAISRTPWDISGSAACMNKEGMPVTDKRTAGFEHLREIDSMLWFSEYYEGTVDGKRISRFDGFDATVLRHAPNNVFIAPAALDYGTFTSFLDSIRMNANVPGLMSPDYLIVGGYKALSVIHDMIKMDGQTVLPNGTSSYGTVYHTLVTGTGNFHLVHNPLFDGDSANASTLRIVNLKALRIKYHCDRKHKYAEYDGRKGLQGRDSMGGDFLSEFSFQNLAPYTHGIIHNVCKAGCRPPCEYVEWTASEMIRDECGRVRPVLHDSDGRLLYGQGKGCDVAGFDAVKPVEEPCLDSCGNIICKPKCDEVQAQVCIRCTELHTIHTSAGDLDFTNLDVQTDEGLASANESFNAWMNEDGRTGTGTISVHPGVIVISVKEYTGFEFTSAEPFNTQFDCMEGCCPAEAGEDCAEDNEGQ